jgi:hypothetical protein
MGNIGREQYTEGRQTKLYKIKMSNAHTTTKPEMDASVQEG